MAGGDLRPVESASPVLTEPAAVSSGCGRAGAAYHPVMRTGASHGACQWSPNVSIRCSGPCRRHLPDAALCVSSPVWRLTASSRSTRCPPRPKRRVPQCVPGSSVVTMAAGDRAALAPVAPARPASAGVSPGRTCAMEPASLVVARTRLATQPLASAAHSVGNSAALLEIAAAGLAPSSRAASARGSPRVRIVRSGRSARVAPAPRGGAPLRSSSRPAR